MDLYFVPSIPSLFPLVNLLKATFTRYEYVIPRYYNSVIVLLDFLWVTILVYMFSHSFAHCLLFHRALLPLRSTSIPIASIHAHTLPYSLQSTNTTGLQDFRRINERKLRLRLQFLSYDNNRVSDFYLEGTWGDLHAIKWNARAEIYARRDNRRFSFDFNKGTSAFVNSSVF